MREPKTVKLSWQCLDLPDDDFGHRRAYHLATFVQGMADAGNEKAQELIERFLNFRVPLEKGGGK